MGWREAQRGTTTAAPFKLVCRSTAGVIVTLIADNYFGYCKKEVKTQISFAANLLGNLEEEHSGGALASPAITSATTSSARSYSRDDRSLDDLAWDDRDLVEMKPEGYAVDRHLPDLVYIPADAQASVPGSSSGGPTTATRFPFPCARARPT